MKAIFLIENKHVKPVPNDTGAAEFHNESQKWTQPFRPEDLQSLTVCGYPTVLLCVE